MTTYRLGQKVLVEGKVTGWEMGRPFGAVTVRFDEGTDPSFLLDGVDVVLPQVVVHVLDTSDVDEPYDDEDYINYGSYYDGQLQEDK